MNKETQPALKPVFKGSLDKVPPAKVLYRLSLARESGVLKTVAENVEMSIHFNGGDTVDLTSNRTPRYGFTGYLVETGKLTELQAWEIPAGPDIPTSKVMDSILASGVVQSYEIIQLFNEFIRASIADLLQLRDGKYTFFRYEYVPVSTDSTVRLNVPRLVIEASRSIKPENFRSEHADVLNEVRIRPGTNRHLSVEMLKLNSRELRVLKLCESSRNVDELLFLLRPKNEHERLSAMVILETFSQIELVTLVPPGDSAIYPAQPARAAEPVETHDVSEIPELEAEFARLQGLNSFERLGVTENSNDADVKRAFLTMAKKCHPDTIPINAPAEIKKYKNAIFNLISESYKLLSSEEGRKAAIEALFTPQEDAAGDKVDVRNILEAEQKFLRAQSLLKHGQGLDEAFNLLTDVINLNPDEAEYRIFYNWVLWLLRGAKDPNVTKKVIGEISGAMKDHPNEHGFLFLGSIFKASGDSAKSEQAFKKVLELAPHNHIASLELRLLQKRR
jgi:curved DNA-binding protein CbpA